MYFQWSTLNSNGTPAKDRGEKYTFSEANDLGGAVITQRRLLRFCIYFQDVTSDSIARPVGILGLKFGRHDLRCLIRGFSLSLELERPSSQVSKKCALLSNQGSVTQSAMIGHNEARLEGLQFIYNGDPTFRADIVAN
jgi:hypothetical protein